MVAVLMTVVVMAYLMIMALYYYIILENETPPGYSVPQYVWPMCNNVKTVCELLI